MQFDHLPKARFLSGATPLEKAVNFSRLLGGPAVYIKRDDLTGVGLGGNKVRKLEYLLGEALAQGCNTAVTTAASSKLNTSIAVRYLAKMYELTSELKYKTAALSAAEYCYTVLYEGLGKYVGGTPDNPNTTDRESTMFALYAFTAAYALGGGEKFLAAAEHAAACGMSWTYSYDFKVPNRTPADAAVNPFQKGGTSGFANIAVGHSGADNGSAFFSYEIYKLYVLTGDAYYLEAAKFFQNNTKSSTDYDGRMGYRFRGLGIEATNIADMRFNATTYWLPWATIASINPIVDLQETFGEMDIVKLTDDLSGLRAKLAAYGSGGKPLVR